MTPETKLNLVAEVERLTARVAELETAIRETVEAEDAVQVQRKHGVHGSGLSPYNAGLKRARTALRAMLAKGGAATRGPSYDGGAARTDVPASKSGDLIARYTLEEWRSMEARSRELPDEPEDEG